MQVQTTIVTPEKKPAIEITLGDLFEERDGRRNDVVQITKLDKTENATYISFYSESKDRELTYGSLAFVNLYKPFKTDKQGE